MTGKPSKSKTPANQAILQGLITDQKPANKKEEEPEEEIQPPKAEKKADTKKTDNKQ